MIETVNLISGGGSTNLRIWEAQQPGGVLHGLVRTLAIICNNSKAGGIQKAIDAGFPERRIYRVSRVKGDLGEQIIEVLDTFKPDFFHQLGWLPRMPDFVMERYKGLNQHLGPGGQHMIGPRRIYAHVLFCLMIGAYRPIPVFCQYVHPDYDQGDVVYVKFEDFSFDESVETIANNLLPVEHEVQVEALRRLATGEAKPAPVPRIFENPAEEEVMGVARVTADYFYRNEYNPEKETYVRIE